MPVLSVPSPFDRPLCHSGVGPGWLGLLEECHARVVVLDARYRVAQYKEKFGLLRVYLQLTVPVDSAAALQAVEVVGELQRRSASICEDCGRAGELRQSVWIRTLCDDCQAAFIASGQPGAQPR